MHRRFQDNIGNKEKQMEREIMMLKKENSELKDGIKQFSNGFNILARKFKEVNKENEMLKKKKFTETIYINQN